MKAEKYLFAFWIGVLVYTSLSVIYGSVGFSAYRQMEVQQKKQEANIENLKLINMELENTMSSLLYDEDTIAVYAREKGYASGFEKFIRIVGLGGYQKTRTLAGQVVSANEPQYIPDKSLRIAALGVAVSIFFCLALFDLMKFLRER